jgi:hypothetical protein
LTLANLPPLTDPNGQSSASTTIEGVGSSATRMSAVPEPSVLALLAAGLAGLLPYAWRRRK